ncbi:M14 family metallopeptidase [Chitinophaga pendula]|uniref:M14 family metallopeptidase n=1 Tax=Chitinophaga TaxID=79328 RepID=UPI000BAE7DA5|nr:MULTISPECIES: M14 family metallopeptidase [Chitinophaga]ASZ14570.1 hypothetical protein CK934_28265 [Chitinophaga sp. MD30]UCJ07779.1 M14 family metallopeptidase [Chitinophaga pendula]
MKTLLLLVAALMLATTLPAQDLTTRYERTEGRETVTYGECIAYYKQLDRLYPQIKLLEMGQTDAGFPLHLVLYSNNKQFDLAQLRRQNKRIILINNGIHPGEPDGIDASMLLLRDLATGKATLPDNVVLAVIPLYNIGGALNRSSFYRVDQNGPEAFGSRGNAQNLDLNRDFIKADSKNARSFYEIFQLTDPDVFIDNHVSNGADYQHVMTLLSTEYNKLGGSMGAYLHKTFEPALYKDMAARGYYLVPYVNHFGDTPENGWMTFNDAPRYSSGYAALFHTFGFVPETHMLKPYPQRVKATYALMQSFISFVSANSEQIRALRAETKRRVLTQEQFPLRWDEDTSHFSYISFRGYASGYKPSEISGKPRLYYDRSKPFVRDVKYYDRMVAGDYVQKPSAYVIPQGWWKVLALLEANKVQMNRLTADTVIAVTLYTITDYKTGQRPYEGHYLHSGVKVRSSVERLSFRKGDYLIPMNQVANRYLMETLEPTGGDSFFAWNFFDPILTQKEGYSSYVFEDTGAEFLRTHPDIYQALVDKRAADSAFANNGAAQLQFVFRQSPYAEPGFMRYPVYRIP